MTPDLKELLREAGDTKELALLCDQIESFGIAPNFDDVQTIRRAIALIAKLAEVAQSQQKEIERLRDTLQELDDAH